MQQRVNFASFVMDNRVIYFNFKVAVVLISVILFSCSSLYSFHLYEVQRKKYEIRHLTEQKKILDKKMVTLATLVATRTKQDQERDKKKNKKQEEISANQSLVSDYIDQKIRPHLFSKIFEILSNQMHPKIWLTQFNLNMDGYHFILQGRAESAEMVADFVGKLNQEQVPGMDAIKIIGIESLGDNLISFKVSS